MIKKMLFTVLFSLLLVVPSAVVIAQTIDSGSDQAGLSSDVFLLSASFISVVPGVHILLPKTSGPLKSGLTPIYRQSHYHGVLPAGWHGCHCRYFRIEYWELQNLNI